MVTQRISASLHSCPLRHGSPGAMQPRASEAGSVGAHTSMPVQKRPSEHSAFVVQSMPASVSIGASSPQATKSMSESAKPHRRIIRRA